MTKSKPHYRVNYYNLRLLVDSVPFDLDKDKKKELLTLKTRDMIYARGDGTCFVCGCKGEYGCKNPFREMTGRHNVHHIIPNATSDPFNLVTLCGHCHRVVHELLFIEGRWRYVRL